MFHGPPQLSPSTLAQTVQHPHGSSVKPPATELFSIDSIFKCFQIVKYLRKTACSLLNVDQVAQKSARIQRAMLASPAEITGTKLSDAFSPSDILENISALARGIVSLTILVMLLHIFLCLTRTC